MRFKLAVDWDRIKKYQ